eukprot:351698-Chlamydomonas_euryale.AAC.2
MHAWVPCRLGGGRSGARVEPPKSARLQQLARWVEMRGVGFERRSRCGQVAGSDPVGLLRGRSARPRQQRRDRHGRGSHASTGERAVS